MIDKGCEDAERDVHVGNVIHNRSF
jgi:hypothetical protein